MVRIGAYTAFSPSLMDNSQGIIGSSWMNFIGYFPEFLWIAEIILEVMVDVIFYRCANQKIESFVLSQVSDDIRN